MMKLLFYTISFIPKPLFSYFVDIYLFFRIFKLSKSYKITKVNLEIAFPEAKMKEIELMSKLSIRESIISGYETIYTWGNKDFNSNNDIFKIENNFLLNSLSKQDQGLIAVTFHNRSVDMLLKWINSQFKTFSLYKKIKIKLLSNFVKKDREAEGSKTYETSIGGVREIFKALNKRKIVVFAADQVPKRGFGEYIKFFNKDAYTTTLVQSLAIKTGSPVIYFYIKSNPGNFLSVTLKRCNKDIYDDSKHKLLLNQDIETIIKNRPVDYSWEYKRFRRSKDINENLYIDI